MNASSRRQARFVAAVLIALLTVAVSPVLAQVEGYSSYSDYSVSGDGATVYGTISYRYCLPE